MEMEILEKNELINSFKEMIDDLKSEEMSADCEMKLDRLADLIKIQDGEDEEKEF